VGQREKPHTAGSVWTRLDHNGLVRGRISKSGLASGGEGGVHALKQIRPRIAARQGDPNAADSNADGGTDLQQAEPDG